MANPQPMEHGRLPDQALADRLDRSIVGIPRNVVYWSAGILLLLVLLSMLQAILLPFVASLLLAYVLNPLVVGLARLGLSRSIAALLLLALFALLFVAALYFLVPLLATQIKSFAAALPATVDRILSLLRDAGILPQPAAGAPPQGYEELIGNVVKSSGASASAILSSLFSGGLALLNSLGLILITPIVTFYLLADWGKVVASAQRMIPRDALPFVEQIAEDINSVLSRFIRGQVLVCLILAVLYRRPNIKAASDAVLRVRASQISHLISLASTASVESHRLDSFAIPLQQAGYRTGFFGKWHMGNDDSPRPGFDHWVAMPGQGEAIDPSFNVDGTRVQEQGYTTDLLTDYVERFIDRPSAAPFLVYLAHKAIHPNVIQQDDGSLKPLDGQPMEIGRAACRERV